MNFKKLQTLKYESNINSKLILLENLVLLQDLCSSEHLSESYPCSYESKLQLINSWKRVIYLLPRVFIYATNPNSTITPDPFSFFKLLVETGRIFYLLSFTSFRFSSRENWDAANFQHFENFIFNFFHMF